jgi:VWFA-related protein
MQRRRIFAISLVCWSTLGPPFRADLLGTTTRQAGGSQNANPAQLIPRSQEERDRRYQDDHRILLQVQVSNSAGEAETSLEQKDFTLFVDEKPQDITQFQSIQNVSGASPVSVILVLDGVNNSSDKLRHFRQGIEEFLNADSGPLAQPVSIANVSVNGTTISLPTRDRSAVMAELKARQSDRGTTDCSDPSNSDGRYLPPHSGSGGPSPIDPNPQFDCLNHRFNASITALNSLASRQSKQPARVVLIWLGEGWPLLSVGNFKPDTPEIKQAFFRDLVTISSGLREQHATLDAIASPDGEALSAHDKAFFDGVPKEEEVTAASLSLHALSHQSGGQVLKKTKDIAGEIKACIADSASYYVLGFDSLPGSAAGDYHSIKVEVGKPGVHVRTSTVYYADQ